MRYSGHRFRHLQDLAWQPLSLRPQANDVPKPTCTAAEERSDTVTEKCPENLRFHLTARTVAALPDTAVTTSEIAIFLAEEWLAKHEDVQTIGLTGFWI
jgi:hypothetical protein